MNMCVKHIVSPGYSLAGSEASPTALLLEDLERRGIVLESDGVDLRFRAPRGALTIELKREIIERKSEILALLGSAAGIVDRLCDRSRDEIDRVARDAMGLVPEAWGPSQDLPAGPDPIAIVSENDGIPSHNSRDSQKRVPADPIGPIANSAKALAHPLDQLDEGPAGAVVATLSARIGILDELATEPDHATIVLGTESFVYRRDWSGVPLAGDRIALDTETARIEGHEIPTLALAAASSGSEHTLIHPDRLGAFLLAHRDRHVIVFNAAFDFWVVHQHLKRQSEGEALECWWAIAEEGRLHDTMLLDALFRLARNGSYPGLRDLGTVAAEFGGLIVNKEDPYRLRYAEIIGQPWDQVERGFFDYAAGDPIATLRADSTLRPAAIALARSHGIGDEVMARYGPLTEAIQVKAAIALAAISRNGIRLDLAHAAAVQGGLRARLDQTGDRLRSDPAYEGLFQLDRVGQLRLTAGGLPSLSRKRLQEILIGVASELVDGEGGAFSVPRTRTGAVSTATEEWAEHAEHHPFLGDWFAMAETSKLCQFFANLRDEVVHPRYTTMVLTGRTSCSRPNIQQIPRRAGFREIFVPTPGHFLLAADYSYIELRALASVCEARYGRSTLADVIRAGRDPHAYTAAMLLGRDPDEFLALQGSNPKEFKEGRQRAKPLNFGIPGGLGPASLVTYARRTYGVAMSLEEARDFRDRMITEVYPEWDQYLSEDPMAILAANLRTTTDACWAALDWQGTRSPAMVGAVRRVVRGEVRRKDGEPYSRRFLSGVWDGLNRVNRTAALAPLLAARVGSVDLSRRLFESGVMTPTGWIRGRVSYAQCRNTPFQHLAATGGKLALWRLLREGYRVIGFVHDEFLVELPDEGGFVRKEEVDRVVKILCSEMEVVLGGNLPVSCEATLSTCWSKDAELIERDGKVYPWRPGKTDALPDRA